MLKLPTLSPTRIRSPGSSPDVERRRKQEKLSLPRLPQRIVASMGNISTAVRSREVSPEDENKVTDVKTFLLMTAEEQNKKIIHRNWLRKISTTKSENESEGTKSTTAFKYQLKRMPSKDRGSESDLRRKSDIANTENNKNVGERRYQSFRSTRMAKSLSADNVFTIVICDDDF